MPRRYGDPEEVAHATLSLSRPAASFINGAAPVVDGGLLIRAASSRTARPGRQPRFRVTIGESRTRPGGR
jgi:hypothetical protein